MTLSYNGFKKCYDGSYNRLQCTNSKTLLKSQFVYFGKYYKLYNTLLFFSLIKCEWVSVERTLSSTAVRGRFIAPEVLSPMEISRSADWWSFGAILLLLYTGEGPSSLIPSGRARASHITYPYNKVTGCLFVCLSICTKRSRFTG